MTAQAQTFDPSEYLRTYYDTPSITDDELLNLRALANHLKTLNRRDLLPVALEVGCGPTIHHAIPLVPHVREIHLCDYSPANLAEVRKWLDSEVDAHDWTVYVRGALAAEGGDTSDESVRLRTSELRRRITELKTCDLRKPDPLGDGTRYDLVTCFYTAECAARDRAEWGDVMRNLAGLVTPGGILFQVSMRSCEKYRVGGGCVPSVPVTEEDFSAVLPTCGFDPDRVTLSSARVEAWGDHGFAGICILTAVKPSIVKNSTTHGLD